VLSVATIVSFVGLAVPAHASGDDYPYRGLGHCPLVPLPKPPATQTPDGPGKPHAPHKPGKPGGPQKPDQPEVKKPAPPRECAKHIWYYNGSYGDPWGFALRNCTSFVAWRLRDTNGLDAFENHFGGVHWGNAEHWDEAASSLGYRVDDVPAIGAVAQTDDGRVGHVAWVSAIGDGTVTVEEYNHSVAGGYGVRTVPTSDFRYLHLDDVAPSPYLGSTRAGVATSDAHEGTWSARVSDGGDLVVQRPSGRVVRLGDRGQWSPNAAPSIVTDAQGRIWVAAVTAAGRVLAAHTAPGSARFSHLRPALASAPTSSPALVVDGQGRVRVLATNAAGTLFERHTPGARSDRWSRPDRMGVRGSWSTHAAPSAVSDTTGAVWVAAVTRSGALLAQHTTRQGRGWSGMHRVDHRTWSGTSTPALAAGWDGRVWLASVGDAGDLYVRHTREDAARWQRPDVLAGRWSPYSSPSLTLDRNGRTWIAAVKAGGRLAVRSVADGGREWQPSRGLPITRRSETASPALTVSVNGVLVGVDRHGRTFWRRPLGPDELLPAAHGPHSGGFAVGRYL
jgi:surface antigen